MKKLLVLLILALLIITVPLSVVAAERPTMGEKTQ